MLSKGTWVLDFRAMDLDGYLKKAADDTDAAMNRFLPAENERPVMIHAAMRYCVFAGGKRLRPVLCIAAAEACGGNREDAMAAACALELMHTYSLVHDDLPCMDDDDLRRGRPTCHKVYGEGMAVLCGDALLTEAFAVLARSKSVEMIAELASAGGSRKLIGGQVMDLEGEGKSLSLEELIRIHEAKTAALLTTSVRLGAMSAGADEAQIAALTKFGHALGLAFQVIDDILDVTQTTENLGKDAAVAKVTYPSVIGLEESRAEAARLTAEALEALSVFGENGVRLREIAERMLLREF